MTFMKIISSLLNEFGINQFSVPLAPLGIIALIKVVILKTFIR